MNAAGRVVGVSVLSQASQFGNINYGVSMDQAWPIIHALLTRGSVTRAAIGMTVATVSNETDRQVMASRRTHLLPSSGDYVAGLLVTYIVAHGPAANAGLRTGDVVLAVNGKRMVRKGDYFDALGPVYVPGQELHCIVYRPRAAGDTRDGEVMELTIRPAPKSDLRATRTAFGAR
ncbi:serine protease [archaeon]|nr:MAG: serine protease [archaeon]